MGDSVSPCAENLDRRAPQTVSLGQQLPDPVSYRYAACQIGCKGLSSGVGHWPAVMISSPFAYQYVLAARLGTAKRILRRRILKAYRLLHEPSSAPDVRIKHIPVTDRCVSGLRRLQNLRPAAVHNPLLSRPLKPFSLAYSVDFLLQKKKIYGTTTGHLVLNVIARLFVESE